MNTLSVMIGKRLTPDTGGVFLCGHFSGEAQAYLRELLLEAFSDT